MAKTRTKLSDRQLPDYTKGEEIFNMVSHIVGGGLGVIVLVACIVVSALRHSVVGIISGSVFGVSMITLYTMSSIYHGLRTNLSKKVFQVIDHCTIFFLIAGTYTPITLCALARENPVAAYVTFGIVWGFSVLGIVLNAIDLSKYKLFSMICYVGTGWGIIFSVVPAWHALTPAGFILLLLGGVFYTGGVLFYQFGKKVRYFHSVFHLFVLVGSILHSLCVLLYAL